MVLGLGIRAHYMGKRLDTELAGALTLGLRGDSTVGLGKESIRAFT